MNENEIDYSIHYRHWHDQSEEHFRKFGAYYWRILEPHLGDDRSVKILDVGCGMGIAIHALRERGYQNITGIDTSKQQIDVALSKDLNVQLVSDTVRWLNENKDTFDIIIALDVLEHVPVNAQLEFAKAICNSLRAGGLFVSTVPNANSVLAARWRYIDWTHTSSFTEHSLEFLLLNSRFQTVQVFGCEFVTRPRYPLIIRKTVLVWLRFLLFRWMRRIQVCAEMGDEGKKIPLSLNLLSVAMK